MRNYLSLLPVLGLCLSSFLSCSKNDVQEESLSKSNGIQKVKQSTSLLEIAGTAHNSAIYAFCDYFTENKLNLFEKDGFSEDELTDFSHLYLKTYMEKYHKEVWETLLNEKDGIDEEKLQLLKEKLSYVLLNEPIDKIGNIVEEINSDFCSTSKTEADRSMTMIVCGVAKFSSDLWTSQWDWTTNPIVPENLAYTDSNGNGDGDNQKTDAEKEKEKQKKLEELEKKARELAVADMFGAIAGALFGPEFALPSAIASSLAALIDVTMLQVAEKIDPHTIDKESYFFTTLKSYYGTDPEAFIARYDNKYEGIIY